MLIWLVISVGSPLYATVEAEIAVIEVAAQTDQLTSINQYFLPESTSDNTITTDDEWDNIDDEWGEQEQSNDNQLEEYAKLDPYGGFNKAMFKLNNSLDKRLLLPVAKGYRAILPGFARKGIRNVFLNLDETITIYNSVLQFKPLYFLTSVSRLVINSTLGIGGLFDVATKMGIKRKNLDWGQTLYRWGWKNSSFFIVPFMGPSTVRDVSGRFVGFYASPSALLFDDIETQAAYTVVDFVSLREELIGITSFASSYELQRDLWLSQRKIFLSGQTGLDGFDGFDDDSEEDDWENEGEDWEDEEQSDPDDEWLKRNAPNSQYANFQYRNKSLFIGPSSAFGLPVIRLYSDQRLQQWLAKEVSGYAANEMMKIPDNVVEPITIEYEILSDIIDMPIEAHNKHAASA